MKFDQPCAGMIAGVEWHELGRVDALFTRCLAKGDRELIAQDPDPGRMLDDLLARMVGLDAQEKRTSSVGISNVLRIGMA